MKNLLAVLAICSCLLTVARAAPSSTPVFQIHLVDTTPTSTSEEMTLASKVQNVRVNVQKEILMDEKGVKSASVRTGEQGQTQIEIVFTDAGKKRFAEITRQNIGRQLAIIIDGRLYCAPLIRTEIPGGRAEISGTFTKDEANALAGKITKASNKA